MSTALYSGLISLIFMRSSGDLAMISEVRMNADSYV
jgi:hypothetical protein